MKKIIALILVLSLSLFAFAACGGKNKGENNEDQGTTQNPENNNNNNNNNDNNNEQTPAEKSYTLSIVTDGGFGAISKNKVTNITLALVYDAEGKIVAARFDSVEASVKVTDGEITTSNRLTTKVEKGDAYTGMSASWANEAAAFEQFLIGKTAAEVAALNFVVDGADAGLVAGCTMKSSMPVFQSLVAEAFAYERNVTFKTSETVTLGLAIDAKLTGDVEEGAKLAADFAAVAVAGGKVVASMIDSAEATFTFEYDEEAESYKASVSYKGSKNEQGDAYDAYKPMASGRWYAQAQAFANTAVGKTVAELADLSTDAIAGSCSIYTGGYKAAIVRAAGNAR